MLNSLMRTAGSFSRSAVMQETGAKTGFAGVFMGLLVTSVLLFLTPLFAEIPQVPTSGHFPLCSIMRGCSVFFNLVNLVSDLE